MNAYSLNPSRHGLLAVHICAAIIVCAISVGLHLSVPEEIADYVSNGLTLPAFRYGLLFALIACGVILSGERRPFALTAHLVILASAIWFGLQWAEPIVLSYTPLAELIVGNPVLTTAMGLITGSALLLPHRMRKWFVPFVSASCGCGLGLSMILESPIDTYAGWFSSAGGLGGMAVILASLRGLHAAFLHWLLDRRRRAHTRQLADCGESHACSPRNDAEASNRIPADADRNSRC